jgi:hypothetical protein
MASSISSRPDIGTHGASPALGPVNAEALAVLATAQAVDLVALAALAAVDAALQVVLDNDASLGFYTPTREGLCNKSLSIS